MQNVIEGFSYTDIGSRSENQDAVGLRLFSGGACACIADGVGGALNGRTVSNLAVSIFLEEAVPDGSNLGTVFSNINDRILREFSQDARSTSATTLTGVAISLMKLRGMHLGDSRLLILRGNGIRQLTEDQTEVARLLREGKISTADAATYPRRNVLSGAIGFRGSVPPQEFEFKLEPCDRLVLMTDGISEALTKREIRDLSVSNPDRDRFFSKLVDVLKNKRPKDNNSIVVIEIP